MQVFLRSFSVAIAVMTIHVLAVAFGVYELLPFFDIVMHFLGGVAMAVLILVLFNASFSRYTITSIPIIIYGCAVLGFVAIVGIAWEWLEFFIDHYLPFVRGIIGVSQASIGDTMADFFFDLLGGLVVFLYSYWAKRKL